MAQKCPNSDGLQQAHDFTDALVEYDARAIYCRACGEMRPLSTSVVLDSRIEEVAVERHAAA